MRRRRKGRMDSARSVSPARSACLPLLCLLGAVVLWPQLLQAQTFQGRVVDQRDERPVPTALVRLVDRTGTQRAVSIADSAGLYQVVAPEPGVYRLEAERLGYENFRTPMLDAQLEDGTYPIDLLMTPAPVEIEGLSVRTNTVSEERLNRLLRRDIGLAPASLRFRPIDFDEITHHVEMGRNLVDVMRQMNLGGMIVRLDLQGWCFNLRQRCLPVYLDGVPLYRDFVETIPLDMVQTIAVVSSSDGARQYPAGAVLVYTRAWAR